MVPPCLYLKYLPDDGLLELKHVANYVLKTIYTCVVFEWIKSLYHSVSVNCDLSVFLCCFISGNNCSQKHVATTKHCSYLENKLNITANEESCYWEKHKTAKRVLLNSMITESMILLNCTFLIINCNFRRVLIVGFEMFYTLPEKFKWAASLTRLT
jgi:hypothetical protein